MKKFLLYPLVVALSFVTLSCTKQPTEAERSAEVDRQVQQRLDAEHQAEEKQKLAEREAALSAREAAAAEKTRSTVEPTAAPTAHSVARTESTPRTVRESSSGGANAADETFYRKLDPFGDWLETGDYGYVFQPREAAQSRSWKPYTNGHWAYTDAGWTWISTERFGWATYHYGRWTRLRDVGWVWVPGDEWAPAWVSWRKSDEYVGWAPLPPEAHFDRHTGIQNWADNYYDIGPDQYSFVAANDFGNHTIERSVVPTQRNVTIINQTTNVTNITYVGSNVVAQGPNYDEIRGRSREPIARMRLDRQIDSNFETDGPVIRGEVISVPVPNMRATSEAVRPVTIKQSLAQTVVEHGWSSISNQQEAETARAKIRAESTPPPNLPPKKFVKPVRATAAVPAVTPVATATPIPSTPTPSPKPAATATPVPSAPAPITTAAPSAAPAAPDQSRRAMQEQRKSEAEARRKQQEEAAQRQAAEQQNMRQQERAAREQKINEKRQEKFERKHPSPIPSSAPAAAAPTPAPATTTPAAPPPTASVTPSTPPAAQSAATPVAENAADNPKGKGKKEKKRQRLEGEPPESQPTASPSAASQ